MDKYAEKDDLEGDQSSLEVLLLQTGKDIQLMRETLYKALKKQRLSFVCNISYNKNPNQNLIHKQIISMKQKYFPCL